MHEKQSPSNKENVKALQVAPPSISFQWLILYNMFLESGFFVDCFFLSYSKTTHTACVRWNEARKKVHALPSFKNTGTSQVFHTSWMHFPFSCPYSTELVLAVEIGPAYPSSALGNHSRFRGWPPRRPNHDPLWLLRQHHKIPCHFPPAVSDIKGRADTTIY